MKTFAAGFSILASVALLLGWSEPATAGQATTSCHVVDVATFTDRVHIHCAPQLTACSLTPGSCTDSAQSDPAYFALETNSPMASNVVQSGIAALTNKRALDISYDDNADANPAGCQQNDCRRITAVVVH